MRSYLVKASQALTSPDLSVESLASCGRLDVVARSMIAALTTRRGVREDTVFYAILEGPPNPPVLLKVDGASLEENLLSEADAGRLIAAALSGEDVPGVAVSRTGFTTVIRRLVAEHGVDRVAYLHEGGVDCSRIDLRTIELFVAGDHLGLDSASERHLDKLGVRRVSVGPRVYFTEHCIAFINFLLDSAALPRRRATAV